MTVAAVIIATLALAFAVLSFWWMNWRLGKLQVFGPRSYCARRTDERVVFRFPFVFFNDGPTPIVVQNLRVVFRGETERQPLTFMATLEEIEVATHQARSMATQFPVRGRESVLRICEFQRDPGGPEFEAKSYPITLQAKLNNNEWQTVLEFYLNIGEQEMRAINGGPFKAHDNEGQEA